MPDAMAGILREQQPTMCPRVRGREGDCNVPIRCMGELDLERSASCQGGEHQPLSSAHEGRAALSAVKLQFGLALDTCRGEVILVCWQQGWRGTSVKLPLSSL